MINKPPGLPVQGGDGLHISVDRIMALHFASPAGDPPRYDWTLVVEQRILTCLQQMAQRLLLHGISCELFRSLTCGALAWFC